MCEKFHQLLAVGRWFPPGTPVSSTRKLISSSFHRLDMTLAVTEALNPNKPNHFPQIRNIPSAYNKPLMGFGSFTAAKYGTRCPAHEYGATPKTHEYGLTLQP